MTTEQYEAAYAPLVASLRRGGYEAPHEGWSAEMIAAHIVITNDSIADAAERVIAGESPDYDNARAIDEQVLMALASKARDLDGLVGEVERSAARLALDQERLTDNLGRTEIHVVIHSDGELVLNQPMPIGEFITVNAGAHLHAHREQLRILEPPCVVEPPESFEIYEMVLLFDNPVAPERDPKESAVLLRQHLGFFSQMYRGGYMKVAGPVRGWYTEPSVSGIGLYQTGSVEKTRSLAEDDPLVRVGDLTVEVVRWITAPDALSFAPWGS
jgi:hypothetical protein